MGILLDFVNRWRCKVGTWARLGTGPGDLTPRCLLQIIIDPDTGEPLALVGILAPDADCVGCALTAGEAYELGELLIECANEIESRPSRVEALACTDDPNACRVRCDPKEDR